MGVASQLTTSTCIILKQFPADVYEQSPSSIQSCESSTLFQLNDHRVLRTVNGDAVILYACNATSSAVQSSSGRDESERGEGEQKERGGRIVEIFTADRQVYLLPISPI